LIAINPKNINIRGDQLIGEALLFSGKYFACVFLIVWGSCNACQRAPLHEHERSKRKRVTSAETVEVSREKKRRKEGLKGTGGTKTPSNTKLKSPEHLTGIEARKHLRQEKMKKFVPLIRRPLFAMGLQYPSLSEQRQEHSKQMKEHSIIPQTREEKEAQLLRIKNLKQTRNKKIAHFVRLRNSLRKVVAENQNLERFLDMRMKELELQKAQSAFARMCNISDIETEDSSDEELESPQR